MSKDNLHNEKELLVRISAGDEMAFQLIFQEWYPRLVLYAEQYSVPAGESEEIVDEAFLKCWQRRTQFDALPKMKSFLYTSVHNASLNAVRQKKAYGTRALPEDFTLATEPDSMDQAEIITAEVLGALYREIEQLPEKCREVVLLTYREGLTSGQIAERLGISVSTITSQRARAIQLLRIALKENYPILVWLPVAIHLRQLFS